MRGVLAAGVLCAGLAVYCAPSVGNDHASWTYHDCVQGCRDNALPGVTLQQCIIERRCAQYPRPRWTYEDCVKRCETEAPQRGQTLQQCIARYVCSQYPRERD